MIAIDLKNRSLPRRRETVDRGRLADTRSGLAPGRAAMAAPRNKQQ
jgi:hypothetical protein